MPKRTAVRSVLLAALLAGAPGGASFPVGLAAQGTETGAPAPNPTLQAGAYLETLAVGPVTYHHVWIRDVTVRSLVLLHDGILASVRLADLSPDLQKAFGYSRSAEAEADAAAKAAAAQALRLDRLQSAGIGAASAAAQDPTQDWEPNKFDDVLQHFGQPPELRASVDLRERFNELGLYVKDQGRRPSCAIFAVVSALEFQYAELVGHPEKLSEEYATWATRKVLGRDRPDAGDLGMSGALSEPEAEDDDLGFSIESVVTAVRTYGIPAEESMPDTRDRAMREIEAPSEALIEEARRHCHVAVYPIPGRDPAELVGNLVQALNGGIPVVVGMPWPYSVSIRSGYVDLQPPVPLASGGYHAVTLVGYRCPGPAIDDAVFVFKNSWGPQWGVAGYGEVTARYLLNNRSEAVLLEVQPPR